MNDDERDSLPRGDDSGSEMADGAAEQERVDRPGPLAWFTRNSVAANVLMLFLLIGGVFGLKSVRQEVFPEFDLDIILVQVPYPGASPEEVEQGVLLAVEEEVRTLSFVKEVRSTALESMGVTTVVLERGTSPDEALSDVKARIDRITSFPEDSERPYVFQAVNRYEVISLVFYGEQSEAALRAMAEQAREDLLADERVSYVELAGVRPYEISIEVPQAELRRYGLTLDQVAAAIRQASVEIPGGGVKTAGGEVLVRTTERRQRGHEFESVVLISRPDGTAITVGDVATVKDSFAETDQRATYDGEPAAMVQVFRVGDEAPLEVAAAVKEYVAEKSETLPAGVQVATWFDYSEIYQQRIDLLTRNAMIGLVLVMLVLGLFLEIKLAFWVMLGIPISFIGAFVFLPFLDVSVNMISLFAFILVLGMVVDDAIVVGEAAYLRRSMGYSRLEAAIAGAREVAVPVIFAIVTTVMAFLPMMFVPGGAGKFFRVIPLVVITVLALSLVESLLILPAHLAHSKASGSRGAFGWIHRQQQRFSNAVGRFIDGKYVPVLRWVSHRRYLTIAVSLALLFSSCGLFVGGHVKQSFMPQIDGDLIIADAKLPFGVSVERAEELEQTMVATAREILEEAGGEDRIARGIFAQIGSFALGSAGDPTVVSTGSSGSHMVEVAVYLVESAERDILSSEFARRWREKLSEVAGLEKLSFNFASGPTAGKPVNVELTHASEAQLRAAAASLAEGLRELDGLYDIYDGFAAGKEQLDFQLKPEARSLGITELDLASQVRSAFFGAEVMRQQRGREEVRTFVRLPADERASEYHIEQFLVRTPSGGEVPLAEAARIRRGRSYTEINRYDGRRVQTVTSEVDAALANADEVNRKLREELLPKLEAEFPGITWEMGGEQKAQAEVNESLGKGMALAMLGVFALLAVVFRSYSQPILIMLAIPFGFVGALWGHILLGYEFSLMSTFGVVALSGVVINDSLILIVAINRYRAEQASLMDAVVAGGARRFRPILLTSLTTFFGLAPMLLETEMQARFLVPMAISLAFGVLFATVITLILIPVAYLILEDFKRGLARAWRAVFGEPEGGYRSEP